MKSKITPGLCYLGFLSMNVGGEMLECMSPIFAKNLPTQGRCLDASWIFYLGFFKDDFEPTPENIKDWTSKWTSLEGSSYSVEESRFISENKGEAAAESKLFVWGVSAKHDGMEWMLMSAPLWKVPAHGEGPLALPFQMSVSEAAKKCLSKAESCKEVASKLVMTKVPAESPLPTTGRFFADKQAIDQQISRQISELLALSVVE